MILVSVEVIPAHLLEARVDHLLDDDDFFRVAVADARADGGCGIGAAIWLRQIVGRGLCEPIDLEGDSQLHCWCSIATVE